jgi:bacteriocin biosynthesis cyclodehydratase domain-containing protein
MATRSLPSVKRHFSVIPHSADVVELRYGGWNAESYTLTDGSGGGSLHRVLALLDGSRSLGEVAREAGVPRKDVQAVVDHLRELGAVDDGPTNALDSYVDRVTPTLLPFGGGSAEKIHSPLVVGGTAAATRVASLLEESLSEASVVIERTGDDALLALAARSQEVLGDGFDFAEAAAPFESWRDRLVIAPFPFVRPHVAVMLNRLAMHHGFSWLHAVIDGPALIIGPLTVPSRSPCFECFEVRVSMNLRESASYLRYKQALAQGREQGVRLELDPVLDAMLGSLMSFEALNFLLTGTTFTVGKALSLYLPTMEFTFNEVLRMPGCPGCGPETYAQDTELFFDVRAILGKD